MNFTDKIKYRIIKKGRGWVFTPRDFLNIRHLNTINPILDRLENRGLINSLGKGLYIYPIIDNETGLPKPPKLENIIRAIEVQLNEKFQYSGEYSAFLLGLSKSLPAEIKYLSNKQTSKIIEVAGYKIKISKTLIISAHNKYDKSILAINALRHYGKNKVTTDLLSKITSRLDKAEINKLKKLAKNINWINSKVNHLA